MIRVVSFPYSRGVPWEYLDHIIDVRTLTNPRASKRLARKNGRDKEYSNLLLAHRENRESVAYIRSQVKQLASEYDNIGIGVGCKYGTHRSVAIAEYITSVLEKEGHEVKLFHIALGVVPKTFA